MYEQVEKPKENKSRAIANYVAQKKSGGKQGIGFVDTRPEAIAQRKLQDMVNNCPQEKQTSKFQKMANDYSIQNQSLIQFVRSGKKRIIADAQKKLHLTNPKHKTVRRRVARGARLIRYIENTRNTGRNVLVATVNFGGRNHTFHLRSAGLGGPHPKYNGKSAAHTEQIWEALMSEGIIKEYLEMQTKPKVTAMYSRNEACDKNISNPQGCRSIPTANMGMAPKTPFYFSTPYSTGAENKPITLAKMSDLNNDDKESNSDDEYVDVEKLRGKELTDLNIKAFREMVTKNPKIRQSKRTPRSQRN